MQGDLTKTKELFSLWRKSKGANQVRLHSSIGRGICLGIWGRKTFALMASIFTMYCTNALGVDPFLLGTLVIVWQVWEFLATYGVEGLRAFGGNDGPSLRICGDGQSQHKELRGMARRWKKALILGDKDTVEGKVNKAKLWKQSITEIL